MSNILLAVCVVAGIGLIVGLVLAIASIIMAVPKDEKTEAVLQALPGANCGACGFSGCAGYAKALAHGKAESGLCSPGGEEAVNAIAKVLGITAGAVEPKTAMVHCMGSYDNTENRMEYQGINSCKAAALLNGGVGKCNYGCMGLGDCVAVCEYNAITVCNGVASIDYSKCKSCGKCVKACPKNIIGIVPIKKQAVVRCMNCDKGALTRKDCKVGCIGCMRCVKACPSGAIQVNSFNATVNPALCTGCGACAEVCGQGCITMLEV